MHETKPCLKGFFQSPIKTNVKREKISYANLASVLNGWFLILRPNEDTILYQSVLKEVDFQGNGEFGIHFSGSILEALSILSEGQKSN